MEQVLQTKSEIHYFYIKFRSNTKYLDSKQTLIHSRVTCTSGIQYSLQYFRIHLTVSSVWTSTSNSCIRNADSLFMSTRVSDARVETGSSQIDKHKYNSLLWCGVRWEVMGTGEWCSQDESLCVCMQVCPQEYALISKGEQKGLRVYSWCALLYCPVNNAHSLEQFHCKVT